MQIRIGSWKFVPGLWPTLATMILLPVFVSLGFWQLDRAQQKDRKHAEFVLRQAQPALDLNDHPGLLRQPRQEELIGRHARAAGQFDADTQVLLDNQVLRGEAGYFVFTPLRLATGGPWLLVNRGWIPLGQDRNQVPPLTTPGGEIKIEGIMHNPPAAGLALGATVTEKLTDTVYRVQRIDLEQIAGFAGHELSPLVLQLAPGSAHGFIRAWRMPGSGSETNLGYAAQWFLFATLLCVIYLVVNLKKTAHAHD